MSIRCATCFWSSVSVAFASLLSSGCGNGSYRLGGASSEAHPLNGAQRAGLCAQGADLEFIDQMEDGDGTIDFTAGRSGSWFAFNDRTGIQYPAADLPRFPMTQLERPRADSHYALRTYGSGFTLWGSGVGFDVRSQAPYNASAYAGIAFWARRAPDASTPGAADAGLSRPLTSALRVNVPDRGTSALGVECEATQRCGDDFGRDLALDTSFQFFSFLWADLAQRGWSGSLLPQIDQSQIYGLRFQTDVDVDFDFWIDDVALLCR